MRTPRFVVSSSFKTLVLAVATVGAALSQGCGSDSGGGGSAGSAGNAGNASGSAGAAGSASEAGASAAGASETGAGGESGATSGSEAGAGGEGGEGNAGSVSPGEAPAYLKQLAQTSFFVGLDFGSPYDSIIQQPITSLNSAIAPGYATAPVAGQVSGSTFIQLVETTQDLYSASEVSASFNVKSGLFGASAKVDYAQSKELTSDKVYLFVDATAGGLATKVVNPALTKAAQGMSQAEFYRNYGDRYVSEIITGVELYGTIEIETTSEQDKESVIASLSVSYGPSSVSASYSTTVQNISKTHTVKADYHTIGYTPASTLDLTDPVNFFSTAANFSSVIGDTANTNAQSLTLVYASYYGLTGYPGVPAGTAANVATEGQALSDYLLYTSLVQNDFKAYYADPAYSALPFFTGMKSYQSELSTFLLSSFNDSQNLPAAPVIDDAARIEKFTTTSRSVSGPPYFDVHTIGNGVVPKRISDYEIPLHYAHGGVLNGVTFANVASIAPSTDINAKAPTIYPLYLVDKTIAPSPQHRVLSYRWGAGTYLVDGITGADGLSDDTKTTAALNRLVINDDSHAALGFYQFLIVNKASGDVLTDHGYNVQLTQEPYTSVAADQLSQLWQFRFSTDGQGCDALTAYASGAVVYLESAASGSTTSAGNRWMDIANGVTTYGNPVVDYNLDNACTQNESFYLYPSSGTVSDMQLISGWGPVVSAYISAATTGSTPPVDGANIIVDAATGKDNELWRFIPVEWIDNAP